MGDKDVFNTLKELITEFNPVVEDAETYLEAKLTDRVQHNDDVKTFVKQVFFGIVKFSKVLNVVVNGFYSASDTTILHAEKTTYMIITYLVIFEMETLKIFRFRKLLKNQNLVKLHQFLTYICNRRQIKLWSKNEWICIYEPAFVHEFIHDPLVRSLPELEEYCEDLAKQIEEKQTKKSPTKFTKNITKPEPFDLTKPKPLSIPIPEEIPKVEKARGVPSHIFQEPKDFQELEVKKKESQKKFIDATQGKEFNCAQPGAFSQKAKDRVEQFRQEQEDRFKFHPPKSNPTPASVKKSNVQIKLNAATILREKEFYKKKQEAQLKRFEALEKGEFDSETYDNWLAEQAQRNDEENAADVARKRLNAKLTLEQAMLAKEATTRENQQLADELKEESRAILEEKIREDEIELEELRKAAIEIAQSRERAKLAQKRVKKEKKEVAKKVMEDSRELMARAEADRIEEARRRAEVIAEIRAIEAVPVLRHTQVIDHTDIPGYGFMNEMSLAELKERLNIVREKRQIEINERREQIMIEKSEKERSLNDDLLELAKFRAENTKGNILVKEVKKKQNLARERVKRTDEKVLQLQDKIEQVRRQRLELHTQNQRKSNRTRLPRCNSLSGGDGAFSKVTAVQDRSASNSANQFGLSQKHQMLLAAVSNPINSKELLTS